MTSPRIHSLRRALRLAALGIALVALMLAWNHAWPWRAGSLAAPAVLLGAAALAVWGVLGRRPRPLRVAALLSGLGMGLLWFWEATAPRSPSRQPDALEALLMAILYVGLPVVLLLLAAKTYQGAPRRPSAEWTWSAAAQRWSGRYAALAEGHDP